MKFREIKLALLRSELEKSNFYEEVTFANKFVSNATKKVIAEWMFCLEKYKKIHIRRFKKLFSQLDEIVFPIKITNCFSFSIIELSFVDNEGKKYYMSNHNICDYNNMETYTIGRRNSLLEPLIDRMFFYKISENQSIMLMETEAMKLYPNGDNDNIMVDFYYNHQDNTTQATLHSFVNSNKIVIKYPTVDNDFDKKLLEFLFSIYEKYDYYYDATLILRWLLSYLSDKLISLSITAIINNEIYSKIDILFGIVTKYIKPEKISQNETHIHHILLNKNLEEFLIQMG